MYEEHERRADRVPINRTGSTPVTHSGLSRSTDRPLRIAPSSPSPFDCSASDRASRSDCRMLHAPAAGAGARWVPPLLMMAQAMRAVLLATAIATTLAGFLAR